MNFPFKRTRIDSEVLNLQSCTYIEVFKCFIMFVVIILWGLIHLPLCSYGAGLWMSWQGTWWATSTTSLCSNTPSIWEVTPFSPHQTSCKIYFSFQNFTSATCSRFDDRFSVEILLLLLLFINTELIRGMHTSLLVSPGIDTSLTGGLGWLDLESLPPGDRPPRSRWEEAVEEDVTTGAKATDWGLNNWRTRGESPNPPTPPALPWNKWPCSWSWLKCLLFHIPSCCVWGGFLLKSNPYPCLVLDDTTGGNYCQKHAV